MTARCNSSAPFLGKVAGVKRRSKQGSTGAVFPLTAEAEFRKGHDERTPDPHDPYAQKQTPFPRNSTGVLASTCKFLAFAVNC